MSAFDRPVRYLAVGVNPWTLAKDLMRQGCEVIEDDDAGDPKKVYVIDLDALALPAVSPVPPDTREGTDPGGDGLGCRRP